MVDVLRETQRPGRAIGNASRMFSRGVVLDFRYGYCTTNMTAVGCCTAAAAAAQCPMCSVHTYRSPSPLSLVISASHALDPPEAAAAAVLLLLLLLQLSAHRQPQQQQ